jgi:hypothetical protein
MKRVVLIILRVLGAVVPLLFAALLGMKELGWPDETFGTEGPSRDTIAALAIATVVFGVAGWAAETWTRRGLKRERRARDFEDCCRLAVFHVHRVCPAIPIDQLGAHVWLVRGKRLSWKGSVTPPHLRTEALFTMLGRPSSPIVWTSGKGAIGTAWRDKEPLLVDLSEEVWDWARQRRDPAFNELPLQDRLGMSAGEVRRSARYRAIGAFPLVAPGSDKVLGVFSVDCSEAGVFECVERALIDNTGFSDVLGTCEALFSD